MTVFIIILVYEDITSYIKTMWAKNQVKIHSQSMQWEEQGQKHVLCTKIEIPKAFFTTKNGIETIVALSQQHLARSKNGEWLSRHQYKVLIIKILDWPYKWTNIYSNRDGGVTISGKIKEVA